MAKKKWEVSATSSDLDVLTCFIYIFTNLFYF